MDTEAGRPGIRSCASCRHLRHRARPRHFDGGQFARNAILEADLKWQERWQKIGQSEQIRFNAGLPFTYEPYTYAWCRHFTDLRTAELGDAAVDPVTGRAVTVYVLCYEINTDGRCARHTPVERPGGRT
jgi:hypothetical protein